VFDTFLLNEITLCFMVSTAWPNIRGCWPWFDEAIFKEGSAMSDDRRAKAPMPVLRTRPATMLTAIGLCVFIMVMQLVPQFSDGGLNRITTTTTTTTTTTAAR
jgi:hypothetical protein